jgi:hypothetical protein
MEEDDDDFYGGGGEEAGEMEVEADDTPVEMAEEESGSGEESDSDDVHICRSSPREFNIEHMLIPGCRTCKSH